MGWGGGADWVWGRGIVVLKSPRDHLIEKVTFEQALRELRTED